MLGFLTRNIILFIIGTSANHLVYVRKNKGLKQNLLKMLYIIKDLQVRLFDNTHI